MKRRRLSPFWLILVACVALLAFWPVPRVEVGPAFERPERMERPQHPRSIYTPKVPG